MPQVPSSPGRAVEPQEDPPGVPVDGIASSPSRQEAAAQADPRTALCADLARSGLVCRFRIGHARERDAFSHVQRGR